MAIIATVNAAQFKRWMEKMDFTIAEAAAELGISVRQVTNYRSGAQPVRRVVELACEALTKRKEQK